jgi:hypothetical protein
VILLSRRTFAAVFAAFALLAPAGIAYADNCFNVSRASLSDNPADFSAPVTKGNWTWGPSLGILIPGVGGAWLFGPPANYQNGTTTPWLLANTPYCAAGGFIFYNGPRTTTNGIQSGCGAFG